MLVGLVLRERSMDVAAMGKKFGSRSDCIAPPGLGVRVPLDEIIRGECLNEAGEWSMAFIDSALVVGDAVILKSQMLELASPGGMVGLFVSCGP